VIGEECNGGPAFAEGRGRGVQPSPDGTTECTMQNREGKKTIAADTAQRRRKGAL
jgi:hypothetical protein